MSRIERILLSTLVLAAIACGGQQTRALVAGPEIHGGTDARSSPYVVRMSDGVRDWEVEFPPGASGYEVRIPLRGRGGAGGSISDLAPAMTDADRELLSEERRTGPSADPRDREGVSREMRDLIAAEGGDAGMDEPRRPEEPSGARREGPTPSPPSYLHGISEVRRLYRTGNPEVAMIRLTELLRSYPDDLRLLAMKGTLWLRLGRPELARRAWEDVLRRDPDHPGVQSALRQLRDGDRAEEE